MFFFFQAEDGIRDADVTGVQTCALPIYLARYHIEQRRLSRAVRPDYRDTVRPPHLQTELIDDWCGSRISGCHLVEPENRPPGQIGRASGRERVASAVVVGAG